MSLTKILRNTSLVLMSLWGASILVGLAAWLHYWIYGLLNPNEVRPLEDWYLLLGISAFLIQLASSIEALIVSIGTRFRWMGYRRGRIAVGVFSLISLAYTLDKLWQAIANPHLYISIAIFAFELIFLFPLGIAWFLLRKPNTSRIPVPQNSENSL